MVLADVKLGYDALKFAYQVFKDRKLSKAEQQKIEAKASQIIHIATEQEIEEFVARPRRTRIDEILGVAEGGRRRGRPPAAKRGVKRAPKRIQKRARRAKKR